jgi:phospholipid transport system transporter-binding protein
VAHPDLESIAPGVYRLRGELSFAGVPDLLRDSAAWFGANSDISVDLAGVTHSNSAGLALLIEWLRLARHHNSRIRFRNIPAQMLAIAKVSGVDTLLPLD